MTPADAPGLFLAVTGFFPLAVLVRGHLTGQPVLRPVRRPFRAAGAEVPLLLAGALFVFYFLGLAVIASRRLGPLAAPAAIVVLLAAGIAAALVARRLVLRPRGTVLARAGAGLLVLWAVFPLVLGTFLLCRLFGPEQAQVDVLRQRGEGWVALAVTAVLVAPVVEEVCFRGLLYPALRRRLRPVPAIVLTSVAFAVVHPPTVYLPLAILAAALAWLVETTGSVIPAISAHMALNGLTVATVLIGG